MKIRIKIEREDGVVFSSPLMENKENIIDLSKIEWKKTTDIQTLHNKYFAMLTELNHGVNTGYSDAELHKMLKFVLLTKFLDIPSYFCDDKPVTHTTKTLNVIGWSALLKELEVEAGNIFNYYFAKT